MPLYEYACEKCGKRFEVMQKFSDDPITIHADCGGQVERLISAPAFHFKGSGWYVNDYAKDKKSESNNGPAKSENNSGDKVTESKSTSSDGGDKSTSSTPASTTPASSSTDSK